MTFSKAVNETTHWFNINNIDMIDSPALVVYKNRVAANINELIKLRVPSLLRPHVKTNKMAEVCQMMLNAGISKFKCATIAEAEMLGTIKAPDVLLAYQPTSVKAHRLSKLIELFPSTHFSCLIDNAENAKSISSVFLQYNLCVEVYIDLNVGMNRTGILAEKALSLFESCKNFKGINIVGLHVYDGHIRDTDVETRKQKSDSAFKKVSTLAEEIESAEGKKMKIIAGGSPTFPVHLQRANVECSPGTIVFWDYGYKTLFPDEHFDYAVLVITRVISIIDKHTICTDLGHKSIAAENTIDKRVHFLSFENITPLGQSEEHLVVKVEDAAAFKIGDVLYGVPHHICPTVALYERAVIVEGGMATGEWKVIARDRKISV
ncbi:MAG: D-TA family PLP-dependent enzyme [Bacteroidetes bacterium]|nr:D-TA family PLP-dependent enzyme [Bacteroidota bacterium]